MPYFSFSLKENFLNNILNNDYEISDFNCNKTYFSKNTKLWKFLNKKKNLSKINYFKFEPRIKLSKLGKRILFCLPPSIGLGDAIEYGIALNALYKANKFDYLGVAYLGRFVSIYEKFFNFDKIYGDIIEKAEVELYDTIFHFSLEIEKFRQQKYSRSDIELQIVDYFNVVKYRENIFFDNKYQIKKISIFPISQSPLRCLPLNILNSLISYFEKDYEIDIVLDNNSLMSDYVQDKIKYKKVSFIKPKNINKLVKIIEDIEFGIFPDSGPLHVAKILQKKGLLITTTVESTILLNEFKTIAVFNNHFVSSYCKAPCGLINLINFEGEIGCYNSLKITSENILNSKNFNSLQRGNLKKKYINFVINPVECIKKINIKKLILNIENLIKN